MIKKAKVASSPKYGHISVLALLCTLMQPIPISHLVVEDLTDGVAKIGGSFRGTLKATATTGTAQQVLAHCSHALTVLNYSLSLEPRPSTQFFSQLWKKL